jgi:hypothetical protein
MLDERKGKPDWWGDGRVSWWGNHVVALEAQSAKNIPPNDIFRVSEYVERQLKREMTKKASNNVNREEGNTDTTSEGMYVALDEELTWLTESGLLNENNANDCENGIIQDEFIDDLLPNPFDKLIRGKIQADDSPCRSIVFDSNEGCEHLELLCYKILVTFHLYGISHEIITDGVWKLSQECSKAKTGSHEWQSLAWLSLMGLNVPRILHDLFTQAQRRVKGVSSYPEEEREAIRLGLEIFGKEWVKIRDYFEVFEGSSRAHLKVSLVTFCPLRQ